MAQCQRCTEGGKKSVTKPELFENKLSLLSNNAGYVTLGPVSRETDVPFGPAVDDPVQRRACSG